MYLSDLGIYSPFFKERYKGGGWELGYIFFFVMWDYLKRTILSQEKTKRKYVSSAMNECYFFIESNNLLQITLIEKAHICVHRPGLYFYYLHFWLSPRSADWREECCLISIEGELFRRSAEGRRPCHCTNTRSTKYICPK